MFDRPFIIRLYHAGSESPFCEFVVTATAVRQIDVHSIAIDGIKLQFGNDYVTITEKR
jgi:hypothetical protein